MFSFFIFILIFYEGATSAAKYPANVHIPGILTTDGGCRKAQSDADLAESESVVTSRVIRDPDYYYPILQYWCKNVYKPSSHPLDEYHFTEYGPYILHCPEGYRLLILQDVVISRVREWVTDQSDRGYCVPEDLIYTFHGYGDPTEQCMTTEVDFKDQLLLVWATTYDEPDGQLGHSSKPASVRSIDIRGPVTDEDDGSRYWAKYNFKYRDTHSVVQRLPRDAQLKRWQTCMWKGPRSFDEPYHRSRLRVAVVYLITEETH